MLEGAKSIGAGAAIGIGNVFSSLIHSVARNPSLAFFGSLGLLLFIFLILLKMEGAGSSFLNNTCQE